MTFYGESYALDWVNALAGPALADAGDSMRFIYADTDGHTVVAGDLLLAGIRPTPVELTATDEAVVSWVIETGAASAGVLALASGLDPTFELTDQTSASEDLGAVSVSGKQTIVLPQSTITGPILYDYSAQQPVLRIECTSGTVDIQQVRLRVWPPDGPKGAWTSGSAFEESTGGDVYATTVTSDDYGYGSAEAAWSSGLSVLSSKDGTSQTWQDYTTGTSLQSLAQVAQANETDPGNPNNWGTSFGVASALYVWEPRLAQLPVSTFGTHPDRVPNDAQSTIRLPGGGNLYYEFLSWNGHIAIPDVVVALGTGSGTASVVISQEQAGLDSYPVTVGGRVGPWRMPAPGTSYSSGSSAPLDPHPVLMVSVTSDEFYTAPAGERQETVVIQFSGASARALVPDHEYWDPGLPWVPERQPRFFVKDHEEVWRPVGFGKPATDLSVFHVWTPVGWYRECRDGETYSDAHPLKVKLYDGTWDTVAHMRPV